MLSVIAVGIEKYSYASDLSPIMCAYKDCEKVYRAFSYAMEDEFNEQRSICVKNVTAHSMLSLLNSLPYMFTEATDTVVLYFSGHGKNIQTNGPGSDMFLCLSDYHENPFEGAVSVLHEVIPALNKLNCNVLLILDTCFSGSILSSATEKSSPHRISILTSTTERKVSTFTEEGSQYTQALFDSIIEIKDKNETFSLTSLQDTIKSRYRNSRKFTPPGESGDVILRHAIQYDDTYFDFGKRFLSQLKKSDSRFREAMWYSLCDIPSKIKEGIFKEYFHVFQEDSIFPPEASWLVRRAIGNAVASIENSISRKKIIEKLIRSPLWQEQCIAVIGARYDIQNDKSLFTRITEAVQSSALSRIDVVWLVNLYTSVCPQYNYEVFKNTSLSRNIWGLQEIWKAAARHNVSVSNFMECFSGEKCITDWFQQCYLNQDKYNGSALYSVLSEEKDQKVAPAKGKSQYIFSLLYGSWQGHRLFNLLPYLGSTLNHKIRKDLMEVANYPKVEYKMAVFDFFTSKPDSLEIHVDSLKWGLSDPHPWVRRAAIQAFKAAKLCLDECNDSIISFLQEGKEHIGEFDLVLEYVANNTEEENKVISLARKLDRYTDLDIKSLCDSLVNK